MSGRAPILIVSGTNRPGSNSLRVAKLLAADYAAIDQPANVFSLDELPPEAFLPGVYAEKSTALKGIQQRVLDSAGLHVVTPEYNGSFPGMLKHFIDLLKFPESFDAKPAAFTGLSLGMFGALRAVEQLQMVFAYRNAHIFPERVFIAGVAARFSADGEMTDADIKARLAKQAKGFATYASAFTKPSV